MKYRYIIFLLTTLTVTSQANAAKLVEVRTVDNQNIMIHWMDSKVHYGDDGKGSNPYSSERSDSGDRLELFGQPLDVEITSKTSSFTLTSPDDPGFRQAVQPSQSFRKSKLSGTAWEWPNPKYSMEHTIYLRLPKPLQQGKRYTLTIASATNSDVTSKEIRFDAFSNISEAVHVNIVGYNPDQTAMKSADLYMWMGDGGARDYSQFIGKPVTLVDTKNGTRHNVGKVAFWKPSGTDVGKWNLTRSDVWTCDFSSFKGTGKFRLAIEGIGCSPEFEIRPDIYYEPFRTSVRGFYYMRIGEPKTMNPIPRQPQYIPGKDPADFKVILTTFGPWHPDWKGAGGDPWDIKDWSKYAEPGNPTNPNAYGGHSDAADLDRHAGHISIIWDLLLPYFLTKGKVGEDNLGIIESGNGIPDLIDEARNEVDFWLRLRDRKGGYSSGLNNPTPDNKTMFQAAAKPYMAWANAANAAMLSNAFKLAKKPELMAKYRDAALEAWRIANEEDLDESYNIGNGRTRGRDLKMMAAAFLYNVTGDRKYEDAMAKECVITGPTSPTEVVDKSNQLWGVAAYLMCDKFRWQAIHRSELLANMKAAVIHEAKTKNVELTQTRPSRRSTDEAYGWFQTIEEVQRVCVAHAVATDASDREALLRALILEADWGLGRNPLNMVQMTGLGSRSPIYIYTSGRNDGVYGVHPGHTPYMNAEPWGTGFMFDPKWNANKGYPTWDKWPVGEALWEAPYCFANNEFTPQQSMRGKMALLGYLYGIGQSRK